MLVDVIVVARFESDLLDHFANELRHDQSIAVFETIGPRFLSRDLDRLRDLFGIVRQDLGADAIFQRRDDLSARRVVFRVRGEHQHHVERQAHRITLNLHVAFLHDVEESDLDLSGEIGQLVDREDAAIRARQQAVMDRQLVAQQVTAFRRFDRIDVTDDVGDSDVRRGEFLDEASVAIDPVDGRRVAVLRRASADRKPRLDETDRR